MNPLKPSDPASPRGKSLQAMLPPSVRQPLEQAQERAIQQWQAMQPRERQGAALAAVLVLLMVVWWLALAPALNTLRQAPQTLESLELQLQQMRGMAAEVSELRAQSNVGSTQAREALEAATARMGEQAQLTVQGDQVTLVLHSAGAQALQNWLSEARSGARALPVTADLSRSGDGYSGSITLTLSNAP